MVLFLQLRWVLVNHSNLQEKEVQQLGCMDPKRLTLQIFQMAESLNGAILCW